MNSFMDWLRYMGSEFGLSLVPCDYQLAHNIIYGAVEYADEFHIKPRTSFKIMQMILEEDDDNIPLMDIKFGRNGKPCLVGELDDPKIQYYLQRLRTYAGEGNFEFVEIEK